MENKRKITVSTVVLLIILVICIVLCGLLILLTRSTTEIETIGISADRLKSNYATIEDTSNTWDISVNEDGSVMATLAENGTLTISGTGDMKDWSYNDTTDWHGMEESVKTVIIGNGVTNIGEYAFAECTYLLRVEIPGSVTGIGRNAFSDCESLTNIKIPGSVINIGNYAFNYCVSLANIEILDGVEKIGNGAFYSCTSLTGIEIPKSVTSIYYSAFYYCENLMTINVDENSTSYMDDNGVLYIRNEMELAIYPEGKNDTKYTILNGTIYIGYNAFYNCKKLTCIEIPESIKNINNNVFYNCESLTSIKVNENNTNFMDVDGVLYAKDRSKIIKYPEGKLEEEYTILSGTTYIGRAAFYDVDTITKIDIPESVINIEDSAFYSCNNLMNINIPESVTSIGNNVFSYCDSLININIPESVTSIGSLVFYSCKVTKLINTGNNIELPNILQRTQDENDILYSSGGLQLTNCSIENNIIKIKDENSYAKLKVVDGKLKELTYIISKNSWDVSENADGTVTAVLADNGTLTITGTGNIKSWNSTATTDWHGMKYKVKKVIINDGVINIGENAFYNCRNLTSIQISKTVTKIDYWSFENCTSLVAIEVNKDNLIYKDYDGVLYSKDGTQIIRYPEGKKETEYMIQSGTTEIRDGAFFGCYYLTRIVIPNGVINIGSYAFNLCESLINVEIPSSVDYIGDGAFNECYRLESIEIPNGIEIIENYTFEYCYSLKNISIPNSIINIGTAAFAGCSSLTSIDIPNSVEIINEGAFFNCKSLTSISIPSSVITIGAFAFSECFGITNIEIHEGVTSIGYYAFADCKKLATISIPSSIINIGFYAFDNCDNLIIICKDKTNIVNYAKENNINYIIIDKINPKTTVSQLIQKFGNEIECEITNQNGKIISETTYVGTGCKVKIKNGGSYAIIVNGDCNGDGEVKVSDMIKANQHRISSSGNVLTEEYLIAADINEDGEIKVKDLIEINRIRLKNM